jgi:surface antigen
MRAKLGWGLVWGAILVSCLIGHARKTAAANCALYARAVTGVDLYGAAGGWWDEAAGLYSRGQTPAVGSILVFRRTGRIPSGHVAVVSKVLGPGEILVDHANWSHGAVSRDMPVVDTSPNHDWTMVAVLEPRSGQLGADYPTYGFVYPQAGAQSGPGALVASVDTAGFAVNGATQTQPWGQPPLFHFAIDEEYRTVTADGRPVAHRRGGRHSRHYAAAGHWHGHTRAAAAHRHSVARRHTAMRTAALERHHRAI